MSILKRATARTPKFFKTLRNIGLVLAAVGGCLITSPIVLPVTVVSIAGYLTVAGSVISAVSQLTTDPNSYPDAGQ